jgi:hypothetical protein
MNHACAAERTVAISHVMMHRSGVCAPLFPAASVGPAAPPHRWPYRQASSGRVGQIQATFLDSATVEL